MACLKFSKCGRKRVVLNNVWPSRGSSWLVPVGRLIELPLASHLLWIEARILKRLCAHLQLCAIMQLTAVVCFLTLFTIQINGEYMTREFGYLTRLNSHLSRLKVLRPKCGSSIVSHCAQVWHRVITFQLNFSSYFYNFNGNQKELALHEMNINC